MKWLNRSFSITLSQLSRRIFVTLLYASLVGTIILWAMQSQPFSDVVMQLITLFTVTLIIVCITVLDLATHGIAENTLTTQRDLDERQTNLRNRAYFIGYILLGQALFLLFIVNSRIGIGYTFLSALVFYTTIPTAVIAWLEPDPIEENEASGLSAV